ncbi:MAG TPA: phosphotransferase [Usitatibacter sp.]|nr:phosphotransferase [Usitatibacter sp.]
MSRAAIEKACDELYAALRRMRLIGAAERPVLTPLAGGVSSDIYRVDLAHRRICIKRALAKLKVSAEWHAPVERNRYEVEWMRAARAIVPTLVPEVLAEDRESGTFAMEYLEPEHHPVWKAQLRDGIIDVQVAAEVGRRVAAIHAATFADDAIARRFPTDAIFHAIRIEPYLLATARAHPECAAALEALADVTGGTHRALVHGDVSPKNILVGPHGPILLDAECAWHGDPAFDVAFCLNHMLLKCLWRPQWRSRYLLCFDALAETYVAGMGAQAAAIERRAARLLPGLFLGRVDGKSPAEYVTQERDKERVRRVARELLLRPADRLAQVRSAWDAELQR